MQYDRRLADARNDGAAPLPSLAFLRLGRQPAADVFGERKPSTPTWNLEHVQADLTSVDGLSHGAGGRKAQRLGERDAAHYRSPGIKEILGQAGRAGFGCHGCCYRLKCENALPPIMPRELLGHHDGKMATLISDLSTDARYFCQK